MVRLHSEALQCAALTLTLKPNAGYFVNSSASPTSSDGVKSERSKGQTQRV